MYKKISLSALVVSALLAMNGCGGGSSSDSSINDTVSLSSTISGVAVDDLILNGVVGAKDTSGNLLDSGRTSDTDGRYTINVNYTGVVLLNVTCDENSKMYNPDTKIETTCGPDVSLNSLGAVTAGNDLEVNISPLTEIVYQRATALADDGSIANIDATDIADARTEIGLMFSVDPLSDDPTVGTYADIIGAIHTLADADPDTSVIDITNLLAEELADGEADGTSDDTLYSLVQVMADENITNNLVETDGTYLPPENPASLSDIDEAKALFTELRTQAMSLTDYTNSGTPGFLDTEAVSMETAVNDVVLNIDIMGEYLNFIATDITYMIDNNLTTYGSITQTSVGTWKYNFGEWSGTISIPEVLLDNDSDAQLYTPGTLTMTVDGTLPLDYEPVVQDGIVDSQSFNGKLTVVKKTDGADIILSGEVASNGTTIKLTEANAELAYTESTADEFGNTEPVLNYFKLHNITMQGIVGGYTIDGSITVNSYVQNALLASKGGFEESTVETSFGVIIGCPTSAVASADFSFSYNDVIYQADDVNEYYEYIYGFNNLPIDVDYNTIQNNVVYTATCENSNDTPYMTINYSWNDSNSKILNSGWLPNDITFAGAISRTGASIEGTLNAKWLNAATMDMESDTETPFVKVTLDSKLQMPERPVMLFALSFENNATHNTLGASYTYDATVINMSALFDTDMNNGDVVITTHTGLQADITLSDDVSVLPVEGTITKDGAILGTLEERFDVPVVKYIDGSFESLP